MKTKSELLQDEKLILSKMNFPYKYFTIDYCRLDGNDLEYCEHIYSNGKFYHHNSLWCDNENEMVQSCWYNTHNNNETEITNRFYDYELFGMYGIHSDRIKIKLLTEDDYKILMSQKLVLSDQKSIFNSIPQLNKEIEKFGYDHVLDTLKSLEWLKYKGLEEFIS